MLLSWSAAHSIQDFAPVNQHVAIHLRRLRYIFNLARRWNVFDRTSANPTLGITLAHEEHRERFLTSEETQRLLFCLSEDHDQLATDAILLLLLTGARRSEITQAKWENLDLRRRTLLVPRSKSGKPRKIILNGHAVSLFRSIQRTGGNPFVFPLPSTGRPPTTLFRQWHRIRCKAGLPDLRLHDLRHSFASFLVNKGVSLYVVQGLLGHTQIRTTQRYAHLDQQTLLSAAEVVSGYLQEAPSS